MENNVLNNFLKWFWLRPENGVLCALRSKKFIETLPYFSAQSLDVSCGDGAFSFISLGGRFGDETDMFQSLDVSQKRSKDFDYFNHFDYNYSVTVKNKPCFQYEFGSDWKPNMIAKAKHVGVHKDLIKHDNNEKLPFEENRFDYVYANSSYWVQSFEQHINDLIRVTAPGGVLVLQLKTQEMEEFTSYKYARQIMGARFCDIIDAGRWKSWQGLPTKSEFEKIVTQNNGVVIEECTPVYGDIIAMMWDCGLRPLFLPMLKLTESVSKDVRLDVKMEWCSTIYDMTEYLVSNYKAEEKSAIEWLYVLKKK